MEISTIVVLAMVTIACGEAVSVFQFFDDIPESILNFFVLDCEPNSLNEARNVFRELRNQLPGRRVDIVTVPLDEHGKLGIFFVTRLFNAIFRSVILFISLVKFKLAPPPNLISEKSNLYYEKTFYKLRYRFFLFVN